MATKTRREKPHPAKVDGRKARTKILTPEQITQVEPLAAVLSLEQIADYFGICHVTFNKMREQEPALDLLYKKGKSKAIAMAANNLLQKVRDKDLGAICFYLKTQAGWKETHEITTPPGQPLAVQIYLPDNNRGDLGSGEKAGRARRGYAAGARIPVTK